MEQNINETLGIQEQTAQQKPIQVSQRYPALRTICGFITVVAVLFIVGTTLYVVTTISAMSQYEMKHSEAWILPLIQLAVGLIVFIILLANAEIIKVLIDIEENTRKTAMK